MDTKACRHCRQLIAVDARLCQHCHGYQSWLASYKDPRYGLIWPVLLFMVLIGWAWALSHALPGNEAGAEQPVLTVSNVSTRIAPVAEGQQMFVTGHVRNSSSKDAVRIRFRVNLFDDANHLIDTFVGLDAWLIVPANSTSPFRVFAPIAVAAAQIKRTEVLVERADARGRFD
jgi:hypothetical protein